MCKKRDVSFRVAVGQKWVKFFFRKWEKFCQQQNLESMKIQFSVADGQLEDRVKDVKESAESNFALIWRFY